LVTPERKGARRGSRLLLLEVEEEVRSSWAVISQDGHLFLSINCQLTAGVKEMKVSIGVSTECRYHQCDAVDLNRNVSS
jgi:hypothetical protein